MKIRIAVTPELTDWDDTIGRQSIAERVLRAGLFSRVVLAWPPSIPLAEVLEVVHRVGGWVQFELVALGRKAPELLELLNAGAAKIWITDESIAKTIGVGTDRVQVLTSLPPDADTSALWSSIQTAAPMGGNKPQMILVDEPWDRSAETVSDWLWGRLVSDRGDGLIPTLVTDRAGRALGLAYSNRESLGLAVRERRGIYWSRSRQSLWRKGDSSGSPQQLHRIDWDCDADTLVFVVEQQGSGFCHEGTRTCFGEQRQLPDVWKRLTQQITSANPDSYSYKLVSHPPLLHKKIVEEAEELVAATNAQEAIAECADVVYFAGIQLLRWGASWEAVEAELARRMLRLTRRTEKHEDRQLVAESKTIDDGKVNTELPKENP